MKNNNIFHIIDQIKVFEAIVVNRAWRISLSTHVKLQIILLLFTLDMKSNFSTGGWIDSVKPCTLVTITLDNNEFNIRKAEEGSPVTINGFPITAKEFDQVLFEIMNILLNIMNILSELMNIMV